MNVTTCQKCSAILKSSYDIFKPLDLIKCSDGFLNVKFNIHEINPSWSHCLFF
jgi:hypothetical protein